MQYIGFQQLFFWHTVARVVDHTQYALGNDDNEDPKGNIQFWCVESTLTIWVDSAFNSQSNAYTIICVYIGLQQVFSRNTEEGLQHPISCNSRYLVVDVYEMDPRWIT